MTDAVLWTKAERRLLQRVNISRQRGARVQWDSLLSRLPGRTKDQVQSQLDTQFASSPPVRRKGQAIRQIRLK